MNPQAQSILDQLQVVSEQRKLRALDSSLDARVHAVKTYQHQRFQHTYADLLLDSRYTKAAQFFLDELYGPRDFIRRDTQFARVVPALVRLFPVEIVLTVKALADLHALSEQLDTAIALELEDDLVDESRYAAAWRAVGRESDRRQQIILTQRVGLALDAHTRKPLLRHSLRIMRGPARAAGLTDLQCFLELGFDTFHQMGDARPFLDIIVMRESAFARNLFMPQQRESAQESTERKTSSAAATQFTPRGIPPWDEKIA